MSLEWLKLETSNLVYMLKGAWSRHVIHLEFLITPKISLGRTSDDKLSLKGSWSLSRDLFNFWKISDNMSKTVRDRLIVFIKFE